LALWWKPVKTQEDTDSDKIIKYFKDSILYVESHSSSGDVDNQLLTELLNSDSISPKDSDKFVGRSQTYM